MTEQPKEKLITRDHTKAFLEIFDEHNNPDPEKEKRRKIERLREERIKNKRRNLGL